MKMAGKFAPAFVPELKEADINENDLKKWLQKSQEIQWDYKNIVKHKGHLDKLSIENNKESL